MKYQLNTLRHTNFVFCLNQAVGGNLDYSSAWEVKIGSTWTVWEAGIDKPAQTIGKRQTNRTLF